MVQPPARANIRKNLTKKNSNSKSIPYLCIIKYQYQIIRIIAERTLREYYERNPLSKAALVDWAKTVKKAQWNCFADIKATFNSVDSVVNQHYVFNIKGNDYRMVVVIKFIPKFVLIRFIGTHKEYEKIKDCSII